MGFGYIGTEYVTKDVDKVGIIPFSENVYKNIAPNTASFTGTGWVNYGSDTWGNLFSISSSCVLTKAEWYYPIDTIDSNISIRICSSNGSTLTDLITVLNAHEFYLNLPAGQYWIGRSEANLCSGFTSTNTPFQDTYKTNTFTHHKLCRSWSLGDPYTTFSLKMKLYLG